MSGELWIILGLILANGLLAGAEMAVVTVRSSRVHELLESGRRGARALHALRENPERFLATVQVGATVIGSGVAAYGGASIAGDLAVWLQQLGVPPEASENLALVIVVVCISFLTVVLGELVPKSLALRAGERYALVMARPLEFLALLATPVVWFLTAVSNLVLKPFGDSTTFTESKLSKEEVRSLVDEATEAGTVDPDAGEIASRALDFAALT